MPIQNVKGDAFKFHNEKQLNLYDCEIGAGTSVGAFCEIGKGVKIGKDCRIGAFCYIPEGTVIWDEVWIGPGVTFLNDKYPPSFGKWKANKPTVTVEWGVVIGARATILPGVHIGHEARIAACAVVTKNVPPYARIMTKVETIDIPKGEW